MEDYMNENNEEVFYDDEEFIVHLTIEGTEVSETNIKITDPQKTIRDQINSIVHVFELPKVDNGGNPIIYRLGRVVDGEDQMLEFEDEDGREQCILDYGIQPGDHLQLIQVPIAGGRR